MKYFFLIYDDQCLIKSIFWRGFALLQRICDLWPSKQTRTEPSVWFTNIIKRPYMWIKHTQHVAKRTININFRFKPSLMFFLMFF